MEDIKKTLFELFEQIGWTEESFDLVRESLNDLEADAYYDDVCHHRC